MNPISVFIIVADEIWGRSIGNRGSGREYYIELKSIAEIKFRCLRDIYD